MGISLCHDAPLREAVDHWLAWLDEDSFSTNLPLFHRVFSVLDRSERRRLLDAVFGRGRSGAKGYRLLPGAARGALPI
jgi:hypothetical protein